MQATKVFFFQVCANLKFRAFGENQCYIFMINLELVDLKAPIHLTHHPKGQLNP